MAENKRWVVTTTGNRPINDVASDMEAVGFAIDGILEVIGSITGFASDSIAEAVGDIAGVADVSPEQSVDIGPPDAEMT